MNKKLKRVVGHGERCMKETTREESSRLARKEKE